MIIVIGGTAICLLNRDLLTKPVFQKKTDFNVASIAKYEKDGNLYIIDSGSLRLICMTPAGKINYTININKKKEYVKIYDCAIDEAGNLYVYATELEYDASLTKRDMIRKYDSKGNFLENIYSLPYTELSSDRPHTFAQFGSMNCEDGILTFSRIQRDRVVLYRYHTIRKELTTSVFSEGVSNYSVGRLALKDFNNFIYTSRNGGVYEVKNGEPPVLRISLNFNEDSGGIIPWHINYDTEGNILFFDMASSLIYRISSANTLSEVLPGDFFKGIHDQGIFPANTGFGFYKERFAGVYGDIVWYYDGEKYTTYEDGLELAIRDRIMIIIVQVSFVLGIIAFLAGIYLLFIRILDRYISLFVKQIACTIPVIIGAFIVFYNISFNFMTTRINQEIFKELLLTASISVELIDGDDVDSLRNTNDYDNDAYKRLTVALKKSIGDNSNEWNKAYYSSIYKVAENIEYCLLMSNDESNMYRPYFSIEKGSGEDELLNTGKPFAYILDYSDGVWAYSNVPIYNSGGKIVGIFEIGIDLLSYELTNAKQQQEIAIIATIICFVIIVVLFVIMWIIIKQLFLVARVLEAIAKGDYGARVQYRGNDELGKVSRGLNNMAAELESQFRQISSLTDSTIRFVPIQFMEHLGVTDITKMKLGDNVQRDLTVLFFDIRFFSINSEMMTAREIFEFTNEVTGMAGPIIRKHNGFVDKYIGDAVMALFADARDAVRAGVEIYHKLVLDKESQIKIGVDGINIGVGIHSGSVMMGIVGEEERLSSTVISPNVNLASRMESLTKQTKSGILITRDTMNKISGSEDEFQLRFIGMIQAAGVNEVVGVFDVLDALPEEIREKRLATKEIFESGIRKYHMKEYQTACERFQQVVTADPGDICAANCLEEAQKRLEDPTLPSVFIFSKK
jgi:class 3 adenylate cyclase